MCSSDLLLARLLEAANGHYRTRMAAVPAELLSQYERSVMLTTIDHHWREHLAALDHLRQGIHLRGYAQKNPKQEYKREAFELFSAMLEQIKTEVTKHLMTVKVRKPEEAIAAEQPAYQNIEYRHADFSGAAAAPAADPEGFDAGAAMAEAAMAEAAAGEKPQPFVRPGQKVGRNDPCPCGSGKKFKQCHGRLS